MQWQKEAPFIIKYFQQIHNHKKAAFNKGVSLANGEFFLPADSDDSFPPDALSTFLKSWENIPEEIKYQFSGVCGLCQYPSGEIPGSLFPGGEGIDSNLLDIRYKYKVKGEKWGFIRTEILKEFPFPEQIPGFVSENVVWSPISRKYKIRFINTIVRTYYQDDDNQISKIKNLPSIAPGMVYWKKIILSTELPWFKYDPIRFLMEAARWTRFRLHFNAPFPHIHFWPKSILGSLLIVLS